MTHARSLIRPLARRHTFAASLLCVVTSTHDGTRP